MMKVIYLLLVVIFFSCIIEGIRKSNGTKNQDEFDAFVKDLERDFIYLNDKKDIFACIKQEYGPYVDTLSNAYYKVLFYENLLNELYDSHINLNANTKESYRLASPVYIECRDNRFFVKNVFSSRLNYNFPKGIINAEVLAFNELNIHELIDSFTTKCHDKNKPEIKEWLANKILSGRRNEPRVVYLKLNNGEHIIVNIDSLVLNDNASLLESSIKDSIGIIRINDALGNSALVDLFDKTLDGMMNTKAIILDLRNTPSGGNTAVAEPIMGRFISKKAAYQICENDNEKYTKYVLPRNLPYSKPLYVLVGRWTGSMGEGMTIGLDGMYRATIIGTEMRRLAGGMKTNKLLHSDFGFSISFEKMYHLNGTLRETFVPNQYLIQDKVMEDEFMHHAFVLINGR